MNDWIEGFFEFTENITSPPLFRKWAGIAAVAGALERKVWIRTQGGKIFPNMYIVLVAPPGVGKTEVTHRVASFWSALEGAYVAPSSVTKASLIDELNEATRRIIPPVDKRPDPTSPVDTFNSLLLAINELGVLLPAYENEFMNTLTDLWDCKGYSERRRTSKINIKIDAPQLNLFTACTPSYLMGVLPEGAWDQGFLSRTLLIYCGERQLRSLFTDETEDEKTKIELEERLKEINELYGNMSITESAKKMLDQFHLSGGEPAPEHPKLLSYNTRRTVHLLKLCIAVSASSRTDLIIDVEEVERAMGYLFEMEVYLPDIFKAMSSSGTGKTMEEAWYFLFQIYAKEKKPILRHRLIQFLQERVPVHNIETTINMMEQGHLIEKSLTAAGPAYKPRGRQP